MQNYSVCLGSETTQAFFLEMQRHLLHFLGTGWTYRVDIVVHSAHVGL